MKLMIVDDHMETRSLIREAIGHLADEIIECSDGGEASRMCAEFRPDLVTMDLNMKMVDGFEATRQILVKNPLSRVIVVTQFDSIGCRAAAFQAGACHFFSKDNLAGLRDYLERMQARLTGAN